VDWSVLTDVLPMLLEAAVQTVLISTAVLVIGTTLALFVALGRVSSNPIVSRTLFAYSWTLRGIPALIILFFAFYGLPQLGMRLQPIQAAIIGLSISGSAYIGEVIRAGIVSVGRGQFEAARSLGLSFPHTMRRIILPQAARVIVPPYTSQAVIALKGSSLAGVIAANELSGRSLALISLTYRPMEILMITAVLYLLLSSVFLALQVLVERRWSW
jgi:His/Glu/Gln/Arg/opine family amino acid ABC transporter permease subunit